MKLSKIAVKPWKTLKSEYSHSVCFLTGFTLIELVIALAVISLIAMIAVPNYFSMKGQANEAMVMENMHVVQLACETYAVDFYGNYPIDAETRNYGFAYYFPGGDENVQMLPGYYPINPYSEKSMTASDFYIYCYAAFGHNSDLNVGGPNDWRGLFAGEIRYGMFPSPAPPHNLPSQYGIIGTRSDLLSIRCYKIIVFHN